MRIGVYKGSGYGQYTIIDTLLAENDTEALQQERRYSSSCEFWREDDDDFGFPETVNARKFEP